MGRDEAKFTHSILGTMKALSTFCPNTISHTSKRQRPAGVKPAPHPPALAPRRPHTRLLGGRRGDQSQRGKQSGAQGRALSRASGCKHLTAPVRCSGEGPESVRASDPSGIFNFHVIPRLSAKNKSLTFFSDRDVSPYFEGGGRAWPGVGRSAGVHDTAQTLSSTTTASNEEQDGTKFWDCHRPSSHRDCPG